ncbi:hypothetical protein LCGC14_2883530 [marine sediment metagenome]|uniref:DUF2399 domain-containing protein n=1 Tax=marine sediment metagenome TaxID=412755 RepID=A0A0F8XZN1_9ZZZZ
MPKIAYIPKKFGDASENVISEANGIIAAYQAQGFRLTLRQLYYQFVARKLITENTQRQYKRLGNIVSDARRAGLIDWEAIEDRTRFVRKNGWWDEPLDIIKAAHRTYHRDLWETQAVRLEVWIEKDALVGVVQPTCDELDVPVFSCRGYASDSALWDAAYNRFGDYIANYQRVIILHLGDHDPSGLDMTRDIRKRVHLFADNDTIEVPRIGLTMDQVREVNPPPDFAKVTDPRWAWYVSRYGEESWELDALEPQYLVDLITQHVTAERDEELWNEAVARQEAEREEIQGVIDRWGEDG